MTFIKKRICIICYSLGSGGAERVVALQSEMLNELGHDVFVVSVINEIDYSYEGTLLNLGLEKDKSDTIFDRVYRLYLLKQFLGKNKIDCIIDHRSRPRGLRELLLKFLVFPKKTIFVIHSMNLEKSFPKNKLLAKYLYKNATSLVTVSKAIEENVRKTYGFNQITTIYNTFKNSYRNEGELIGVKETYILYFGRLEEDSKDLSFLIRSYSKSSLPSKRVLLYIVGNGPDLQMLQQLVTQLELKNSVVFLGYTDNPFSYVKKAKFTVLTSNYEGFPMSLIESLACKTPVVTVDCESGPKEIIRNEYNGLLVQKSLENYTTALNRMNSDAELLATCRNNCLKSIEHLSFQTIKNEWGELIDSI